MPVYIYDASEYTPFHEVYDLCVRLECVEDDSAEAARLREALRDALCHLDAWLAEHRDEAVGVPPAAVRTMRRATRMSGT